MDVRIEGYFHEPEKPDYPNINQSGGDSKLSSDTKGETAYNFHDKKKHVHIPVPEQLTNR